MHQDVLHTRLRMHPRPIRHRQLLTVAQLRLKLQHILRHLATVRIKPILLAITPHHRKLRPVNHAQLIRRHTQRQRHNRINLHLRGPTLLILSQRLIDAPGFPTTSCYPAAQRSRDRQSDGNPIALSKLSFGLPGKPSNTSTARLFRASSESVTRPDAPGSNTRRTGWSTARRQRKRYKSR